MSEATNYLKILEADPKARAEFNTVCDQWQNDAIVAQDEAACECDICSEET